MAHKVFLHIGTPKSATTYIQQSLWLNKTALRESGVLLPFNSPVSHWRVSTFARKQNTPKNQKFYKDFMAMTDHWAKDVVFTSEVMCSFHKPQIREFVSALEADEVHVVLTCRDFLRQVGAEWQQHVKGGDPRSMEQFIADAQAENPDMWFWRVQDVPQIIKRWSSVIPAERFHIVTVPHSSSDPALVWDRFCSLLGYAPGELSPITKMANESLSFETAESLRRLSNATRRAGDALGGRTHRIELQQELLEALSQRGGTKIKIPRSTQEWAAQRSNKMADEIASLGLHLVGSIDDLRSSVSDAPDLPEIGAADVLPVAASVIHVQRKQLDKVRGELQQYRNFETKFIEELAEFKRVNEETFARLEQTLNELRETAQKPSYLARAVAKIRRIVRTGRGSITESN